MPRRRERLTILSSIGLDSLHPYAHSSSPQYGIWHNMIEPLVEVDYGKKEYFGVLAESWEFQGKKWVFRCAKESVFTTVVRLLPRMWFTPLTGSRTINRVLQKENFQRRDRDPGARRSHRGVYDRDSQRRILGSIAESLHDQQSSG